MQESIGKKKHCMLNTFIWNHLLDVILNKVHILNSIIKKTLNWRDNIVFIQFEDAFPVENVYDYI